MPVFALSVTLLLLQIVVLPPAVIVADGADPTATVTAALVVLHEPLLTITVWAPAVPAVYVAAVAPLMLTPSRRHW